MSKYTLNSTTEMVAPTDTLGGSYTVPSGLYLCEIKHAYIKQAASGALALSIAVETTEGKKISEDHYFVSGDAKGNKTFYTKDGKNFPLPSYTTVNNICMLTLGKSIDELLETVESKVLNVYDSTAGKEIPTEVDMIMALVGQKVQLGILEVKEDKTAKDTNGNYTPTGDTRTLNRINYVFSVEGTKTLAEKTANTDAKFSELWVEKNAGSIRDLSTKVNNNNNNSTGTSSSDSFSFS